MHVVHNMLVTHQDMRALGYCNRGAREWAARRGLDWAVFVMQGLPEEALLATHDAMASDVVAQARRRIGAGSPALSAPLSAGEPAPAGG